MNYNINQLEDLLKNKELTFSDKKIIYQLYGLLKGLENQEESVKLSEYEDEIFTVEGKILSDKERLRLVAEDLNITAKDNENFTIKTTLDMLNKISKRKYLAPSMVSFLKKLAVKLQILLGEEITFYSVLEEMLDEEMSKTLTVVSRGR
ncbi:MAG: hypothetical protein ACLUFU_00280 [Bacilli bacterium]